MLKLKLSQNFKESQVDEKVHWRSDKEVIGCSWRWVGENGGWNVDKGGMDFVKDFANPLPCLVVGRLVG